MNARLHWERKGRFLDLCDGDELLASVETRRRKLGPTTYHWVVTCRRTPIAGMAYTLDEARQKITLYL
jgi:hypothetical protein